MLDFLITILFFAFFFGLIVGLIKPSLVLKSLSKEEQSRKNVLKYFGIGLLVSAFMLGLFNPSSKKKDNVGVDNEKQGEITEETDVEDISSSQSLIDTPQLNIKLMTAAEYFVEEYEKQRIKGMKINTTAVYSEDIVRDQSGQEFPYSFMIVGRYEERGNGALRDFVMTIGYKDAESYDKGLGSCIQYINEDTGAYINVMDPEDDAIVKLLESLGE